MTCDLPDPAEMTAAERDAQVAVLLARALVRSRLSGRSNQLDDHRHDGLMAVPVDGRDWPEPPEPVMEVTG